jgi:type VI secretion system protein ImpM
MSGPLRGFSGKVPARGDFVHAGLPRDFTDPWHDWQSLVIAGSRTLMGDAWLEAFLEAPVWRFILPPGVCGARAAIGLIMPSVDKVGRYFPLTLAALPETGTPVADDWAEWLDSAENLGRLALDEDAPPEQLMPPPAPSSPIVMGVTICQWWTTGGPRVEASRLSSTTLPDPERFASMLGHLAPTESAP